MAKNITNQDIYEFLEKMRKENRELFATKIEVADLSRRIGSVESNLLWSVRIVIGTVIAAVLGFLGLRGESR